MERIQFDHELDDIGHPKRNPEMLWILDAMLGFVLMPLAVFSLSVVLGILLKEASIPIAKMLGYPFGFVVLFVAWSVCFVTIVLFSGKWHFTNSLFSVLKTQMFPYAQFFIVLGLFVSKFLYTLIRHGNLHFKLRVALSICFFLISSFGLDFIVSYARKTDLTSQIYCFYFVEFVLFEILMVLDLGKFVADG